MKEKNIFIIERVVVGPAYTNCYIFGCQAAKTCAVIDPGDEADIIKKYIEQLKLKPECIIITHGHIDHIGAIEDFELPVYAGILDSDYFTDPAKSLSFLSGAGQIFKKPSRLLKENDRITIGECVLKILEVPGHTPGSICLLCDGILFSGDTLFAGGIGRTDLPNGSHKLLVKMIKEKLLILDETVKVYPGHGESTTIKDEKDHNPFLSR